MKKRVEGDVSAVAFGGEGILRADGLVVFVPFTARGDKIDAELAEVKKSFARAKLVAIKKPSEHRVTPKCRHFGECGGCQLQHVNYEEQLALKHDWVAQSLVRIGKIEGVKVNPVIGAQTQWNYRRVIKLRFRYAAGKLALGYVNAASNGITEVQTCPIFTDDPFFWESLNEFLVACFGNTKESSGVLSLFRIEDGEGSSPPLEKENPPTPFSKGGQGQQFVAWLDVEAGFTKELLMRIASLPPQIKGLLLTANHKRFVFGDTALRFMQDGLAFSYTPQSFVQNHAEQSAKINRQIVEAVKASGAKSVFDLYCGFGVTAISLAKNSIVVTAVEGNAESIRLAHINAKANEVTIDWVCDDVGAFIVQGLRKVMPDAIIVNPPRTGLSHQVVTALADYQAAQLIYVSCMPQTLSRDLAILVAAGYTIESCQPFDMFPQTTHVETMIVLKHLRAP